jgi:hypothetical protein
MKRSFLTCLIILLFPTSQQAQDSSGFFPHHVGDLWEYYYWDGIVEGTIQDRVISDSIDQLGNIHLLMKRITYIPGWPQMSIPWYDHCRIDSAGNVFARLGHGTERHLYKAELDLWEIWTVEEFTGSGYDLARLEDVRPAVVFEIPSTVREIVYYGASTPAETTGLVRYAEYLADGFGVIYRGGGDLGYALLLRGASIGGELHGDTTTVGVENREPLNLPLEAELLQNYPNPFNPRTVITYVLPRSAHVTLRVFDVLGHEVCRLVDGVQGPGTYRVNFDATHLASGMYLYRLDAGASHHTGKMIVQR